MVRFMIRLAAVVIVASLPYPLSAESPGDGPRPSWRPMSWQQSHDVRQGPETTERISRQFKVGPRGTLDITNVSGRIVVTAGGADTIVVEATKRVRSRGSDVKVQLERTVVSMTELGGRVEVTTGYTGRNLHASVDYLVTAPPGTSVYAHSMSGDIRVANIRGEVQAQTVSGNVDAVSVPGATLVKTMSGDVTVSGVSNEGDLRATTVSGTVTVNGAKVRSLDASSISGDVDLRGTVCERVSAGSISGNVSFEGTLEKSGRYEFKSQSGDIRLALAGATGFEVDASTFSGNVRSDLPVTVRSGGAASGRSSRHSVHGVFGDGSAQLSLRSFSGDITIAKK